MKKRPSPFSLRHTFAIPPNGRETVTINGEDSLNWLILVDLKIAYLPDFSDAYEIAVKN
jgi:hypothetical protein